MEEIEEIDDDDATVVTDDEPKMVKKAETPRKAAVLGEKRKLDVKSKKWDGVYKEAKLAMGGLAPSELGFLRFRLPSTDHLGLRISGIMINSWCSF